MGVCNRLHNNALTDLFHRYLDFLYNTCLIDGRNKTWMREGDLDKVLCEPFSGNTLRLLLNDQCLVKHGMPNIIIFQGEKGDGRRFFIRKMIELCYENIHHICWQQALDENVHFRFPVHISNGDIQSFHSNHKSYGLFELACHALNNQLELSNVIDNKLANELINELGRRGKLAVFFDEESYMNNTAISEQLYTPEYLTIQPLALFVELPEFTPKTSKRNFFVRMEPLSNAQIVRYLTAELPQLYSYPDAEAMLSDHPEVTSILCKPEYMQLHIRVIQNNPELMKRFNISGIYEAYLSSRIDQAYECRRSESLSKENLENWLIKIAENSPIEHTRINIECRFCFSHTDVFQNDSDEFRFEEFKYYLIAKSYFIANARANNVRKRLSKILDGEDLRVLKFYSSLYIAQRKDKDSFFGHLINALSTTYDKKLIAEPAKILADILIFTNRVDADGRKFVAWACEEMENDTYDTSVLETLSMLSQKYPNADIPHQLSIRYESTNNYRVKRRIAYCFGYMEQIDFPSQLIDDLCDEDQQCDHLKYHISAAITDNCKRLTNVDDFYARLDEKLGRNSNPILRSDFDTLYFKLNSRYFLDRALQESCEDELIKLIESGEYWEKTHAAGALGRRYGLTTRDVLSIVSKLTKALERVMTEISALQHDESEGLKVISYIVETSCHLACNNDCVNGVRKELQKQLETYLNRLMNSELSIVAYKHTLIALKLLNTGAEHLIECEGSIKAKLSQCFTSKEDIIQCLSRWYSKELDADWAELKDAVQRFKAWSTPEEAEKRLLPVFPKKSGEDRKLRFSLTYLWHKSKCKLMGFLYFYHGNIYFITCRHCFFYSDKFELHSFAQDFDNISFSPACLDTDGRYHGVLCSPDDLTAVRSFDDVADEDIVIFRMTDIPASFASVIYSEKDLLTETAVSATAQLSVLGFPKANHGVRLKCSGYSEANDGFFSMHGDEGFHRNDVFGYSGAPVVTKSNCVVGMWKSSISKDNDVLGITIQSIHNALSKCIDEEDSNNE